MATWEAQTLSFWFDRIAGCGWPPITSQQDSAITAAAELWGCEPPSIPAIFGRRSAKYCGFGFLNQALAFLLASPCDDGGWSARQVHNTTTKLMSPGHGTAVLPHLLTTLTCQNWSINTDGRASSFGFLGG